MINVPLDKIIPVTYARDNFASIIKDTKGEDFYVLSKGGRPKVVLIDIAYLEELCGDKLGSKDITASVKNNSKQKISSVETQLETPPFPSKETAPAIPEISQVPTPIVEPVKMDNPPTVPTKSEPSVFNVLTPSSSSPTNESTNLGAQLPTADQIPPTFDATIPAPSAPNQSLPIEVSNIMPPPLQNNNYKPTESVATPPVPNAPLPTAEVKPTEPEPRVAEASNVVKEKLTDTSEAKDIPIKKSEPSAPPVPPAAISTTPPAAGSAPAPASATAAIPGTQTKAPEMDDLDIG